MKPKFINDHPIRKISECRVRCEHCGRSFLSPAMYKSLLDKIIAMYGSLFRALIHTRNVSNDAVHMPRLLLWVHWYICCIFSEAKPQRGQKLVVACPCCFRIIIVGKV